MEDIKALRSYVIGVLAFATAASTFLVNALHLPLDITLISAAIVASALLLIGWLIGQSEKRQERRLERHIDESGCTFGGVNESLEYLKMMALENQRSSLRNEMNWAMWRNPANHDTIVRYAYKYFQELGGDWVETELFQSWLDSEEQAGRPVHLPRDLFLSISQKHHLENNKERSIDGRR